MRLTEPHFQTNKKQILEVFCSITSASVPSCGLIKPIRDDALQ